MTNIPVRSHHFSAILPTIPTILTASATDLLAVLQTHVEAAGLRAVTQAGATFQPQGVSVVLILEESHVALHIWTKCRKATVDIHVFDSSLDNFTKAKFLAERLTAWIAGNNRPRWHYWCIEG
ncbi:S-adenosylmethionine decarboxylase [Leptodesmis sp.]|uniref:S-adenosylmethionine decarboxylase n=1 Tax=Leptodesmis sp. TaxID=3100501 RepID=UPI0040534D03